MLLVYTVYTADGNKQAETTINLPHMNLIILSTSACPSSWSMHSKLIVHGSFTVSYMLVARLWQSAVL